MSAVPWIRHDVPRSLTEVALDLSRHCADGSMPSAEQLRRWLLLITGAQRAFNQLKTACEVVVEVGASADQLAALERALAATQGQDNYVARHLRW